MQLSYEQPLLRQQRQEARLPLQKVQEQRGKGIVQLIHIKYKGYGHYSLPRQGQIPTRDQGR